MENTKILIVDDDARLSSLVNLALTEHGFDVREENRSSVALASARQYGPDAIILDVDMPGKGGFQVAAELRMDPDLRAVPILFLTALISAGDRTPRNGSLYCAKPVDTGKLIAALRALLGSCTPKITKEIQPGSERLQ